LGRLFLFLINIYFFFAFFFFGAQVIMVLDSSDILLFIRFRAFHSKKSHSSFSLKAKLFGSIPSSLEKYVQEFKKGETIISQGSLDKDSYYIVSGSVGVYLDKKFKKQVALIETAHFFGEMEAITLEERAATIRAETDLTVICLPPVLFHAILQIDPDTDKTIIKTLSKRLKSTDRQILKSEDDL